MVKKINYQIHQQKCSHKKKETLEENFVLKIKKIQI